MTDRAEVSSDNLLVFFHMSEKSRLYIDINLCMRAINTHLKNPFSTFFTYFYVLPENGKSDKSQTVLDMTSICIICL